MTPEERARQIAKDIQAVAERVDYRTAVVRAAHDALIVRAINAAVADERKACIAAARAAIAGHEDDYGGSPGYTLGQIVAAIEAREP